MSVQMNNASMNIMQMATASFFQTNGGVSNCNHTKTTQSPIAEQLGKMVGSWMADKTKSAFSKGIGAGQDFMRGLAQGAMSGILTPPRCPKGHNPQQTMAQMPKQLSPMNNMWNKMGNFLGKALYKGAMSGMMGPLMQKVTQGLTKVMQGLSKMMNMLSPQMQMGNDIKNQMLQHQTGSNMAQNVNNNAASLTKNGGMTPAKFPTIKGGDFINSLPTSRRGIARALNVSGRRDEKRIQRAVGQLKTAAPKISAGKSKGGPGKLQLSSAQVEAIRNAPDAKSAKKLVLEAFSKQTGVNVNDLNMGNKRGIRSSKYRNCLNKLLGSKVRNGREKNSGSAAVLDNMAEKLAKSLRGGNFGSKTVQSPGQTFFAGYMASGQASGQFSSTNMAQSTGGPIMEGHGTGLIGPDGQDMPNNMPTNCWGGFSSSFQTGGMVMWSVPGQTSTVPNPASEVSVDLTDFNGATSTVGTLASPLIFDLEGTGLDLKGGGMVEVDIDGDGSKELITDLDAETGLLVFDSKEDGLEDITGADMFGDNTDLTKYGIEAPTQGGKFKDGFQALRALCEHYKLVNDGKQFLDAGDLAFLEEEVGLRMRVGGVADGDDRRFAEVGVTEVNLGNPNQTQHLEDAPEDRWGNKIIYQDGATFTVFGEVRKYADIWFKIQARYGDDVGAKEELKAIKGVELLSRR